MSERGLTHDLTALRAKAREFGWALALHGSCKRDLDFVAVPWIANAQPLPFLIDALADEADCHVHETVWRPHGRIGFLLHPRGGGQAIDISAVDPRSAHKRAFIA